ncbi:MAG: 2,3-bisphosphoglycerate-independent phosphoglycerate mutase [Microgenomates bacterium OLB23]|nr:MAG: 2,3-bisphosphoglycerate-independent phosphoglycerate mutase [Microgenomates bacterium OLB23]
MKGVLLVIFDGLGIALPGPGNAYFLADPKNLASYYQRYPHTQLKASGESVGLPADEVGSTEVGHLNIGAGRIVYQSLPRINLSIADGSFFKNDVFVNAIKHAKANNSKLHIIGLLGGGTVHSSTAHLYALLFLCQEQKFNNVYLHIITDGRDSPPKSVEIYLEDLQNKLIQMGIGTIATVMGRYYAMDRDRRWERVEKAYKCLTEGIGDKAVTAKAAVEASYEKGLTDEFIMPTSIVNDASPSPVVVSDNDAVIFYNFRIDRPRELAKAFVLDSFESDANKRGFDPYAIHYHSKHQLDDIEEPPVATPFTRVIKLKNLYFATMTEYEEGLPVHVAFPPHVVDMPLGRVISEAGFQQIRLAESEKERFVTHYFNGLRNQPFPQEDRLIVPSPKVATYDLRPEMSARELTQVIIDKLKTETYKFMLVNYANPDMVGHTGNLTAAIKAVQVSDECIGKIVEEALKHDYSVVITADHGNVEEMLDPKTGGIATEHSGNNVPFIAISNELQGKNVTLPVGILADIAPTILALLNIAQPPQMTGRNLLEEILQDD